MSRAWANSIFDSLVWVLPSASPCPYAFVLPQDMPPPWPWLTPVVFQNHVATNGLGFLLEKETANHLDPNNTCVPCSVLAVKELSTPCLFRALHFTSSYLVYLLTNQNGISSFLSLNILPIKMHFKNFAACKHGLLISHTKKIISMPLSGMFHYLTSDTKLRHLFNMSLNTVFFHEVFFDSSSLMFDMVSDMYNVTYLQTHYFITCILTQCLTCDCSYMWSM